MKPKQQPRPDGMDGRRENPSGPSGVVKQAAKDNLARDGHQRHVLKCDSDHFQAIAAGRKTFELRIADRNYRVGDDLFLKETEYSGDEMRNGKPLKYTGRTLKVKVSHIMSGNPDPIIISGLKPQWMIMSIKLDKFPELP